MSGARYTLSTQQMLAVTVFFGPHYEHNLDAVLGSNAPVVSVRLTGLLTFLPSDCFRSFPPYCHRPPVSPCH